MNEKSLHTLTIDPEFRDLIPPLTTEELKMLEESIIANGCESPLIVWNGIIVDGHNRYAICHKHGIPFMVQDKQFSERETVIIWMLQNQLGRRNLNNFQKGELALKYAPYVEQLSRQGKKADSQPDFFQRSGRSETEGVGTDKKLAKLTGVSHDTIHKVRKLSALADEETKDRLRRGEMTVRKAYMDLVQKQQPEKKQRKEAIEPELPETQDHKIVDVIVEEKPVEIEVYRAFKPHMIQIEGNVHTVEGADHDHLMGNPIYRQLFESYNDAVQQINLARGEMRTRCEGYERRIRAYEENLRAFRNEVVRLRESTGAALKAKDKSISGQLKPHPVNGMAMLNGAPIHVVTPLPDEPEMMPHVMNALEAAISPFLATVGTTLRMMTKGIATKENLRIYEDALLDATERAHEMFNNHVKELEKQ